MLSLVIVAAADVEHMRLLSRHPHHRRHPRSVRVTSSLPGQVQHKERDRKMRLLSLRDAAPSLITTQWTAN